MTNEKKCKKEWHQEPVFFMEVNSVICLSCEQVVKGRLLSEDKIKALIEPFRKLKKRRL